MTVHKLNPPSPFKIERDIPLPSSRSTKYPFPEMAVGDSLSCSQELCLKLRDAAFSWGRKNGRKFSSRKQPDGTYRIWRTA